MSEGVALDWGFKPIIYCKTSNEQQLFLNASPDNTA